MFKTKRRSLLCKPIVKRVSFQVLRGTEKQRNRETEKQRNRETEKQRNRETEKQRNRETEGDKQKEKLKSCTFLIYRILVLYFASGFASASK